MAFAFHSIDQLGPPFLTVDEVSFVIPKDGRLSLGKHHFKLLFVLNGRVLHSIDGHEEPRPLEAGDILIAPVVNRHDYINTDRDRAVSLKLLRMFLDARVIAHQQRKRGKRPETELTDFVVHHFRRVVQLKQAVDSEIASLIGDFRREAEHRQPGYHHRARAVCASLIVAAARKLGAEANQTGSANGVPGAYVTDAAKEFIYKHFNKDITLGEIAWHVGKGEEHLARTFKRHAGKSVFDFVREIRINHAKTLLLDPTLSLTAIAEQCGFHSLAFFSRSFRQLVGMAPSQYRRHIETVSKPWLTGAGPRRG